MKEILTLFVLAGAAINSGYAQFDPAKLIPETLHYRLLSGSVEVGSSTVTISRDNAVGAIHIVESISGLFEQTAVVSIRDDTSLQPLACRVVIARDNQYHELKLHYREDGQRVTGEIRRPPELGGARVVDTTLPSGAVDLFTVPYLFRASPLAINKTFQFPLFNGLQNEKGIARAWVSRLESVVVPSGTFKCYRLEAFTNNSRVILNLDTQFPHRLIRQIMPELEVKFELITKE
jgi:hypothetical protein